MNAEGYNKHVGRKENYAELKNGKPCSVATNLQTAAGW